MSEVQTTAPEGSLMTVDELAAAVGLTVRTTRYYASLGLLPPPVRRGRVGYYTDAHVARLQMVRALQDHGMTLQAIEGYMGALPPDTTPEDLALKRTMLMSWVTRPTEELTRDEVEARAGRSLSDEQLALLVDLGTLEPRGSMWVVQPNLDVGVDLLDLDIPQTSIGAAGDAIRRHMEALADELTDILRLGVVDPFRNEVHTVEEAEHFERTLARLRQLTLEAIVTGFQRAANNVIRRSMAR